MTRHHVTGPPHPTVRSSHGRRIQLRIAWLRIFKKFPSKHAPTRRETSLSFTRTRGPSYSRAHMSVHLSAHDWPTWGKASHGKRGARGPGLKNRGTMPYPPGPPGGDATAGWPPEGTARAWLRRWEGPAGSSGYKSRSLDLSPTSCSIIRSGAWWCSSLPPPPPLWYRSRAIPKLLVCV